MSLPSKNLLPQTFVELERSESGPRGTETELEPLTNETPVGQQDAAEKV